jgi:hypothetical protein
MFMFLCDHRMEAKIERWVGMGEMMMRNWDFREFLVQINLPFPIQ